MLHVAQFAKNYRTLLSFTISSTAYWCEDFHFSAYYWSTYSYCVCAENLSRFSKLWEGDLHEGSEKECESYVYMLDIPWLKRKMYEHSISLKNKTVKKKKRINMDIWCLKDIEEQVLISFCLDS